MGRIVFFLLLAIVAYMVWRSMQRRGGDRGTRGAGAAAGAQAMVSCATCGLHLYASA